VELSRLGECAVRADVKSAMILLNAEPGTAREKVIFDSIMPVFEGCVTTSVVYADTVSVRGEIATNLMRLAHSETLEATK
jgi:hypothetical protein